jgi:hypothetical protein
MCKPLIPSLNVDISQFSYVELIMPNSVLGFWPSSSLVSLFVSFISPFLIAATPFPLSIT